MRVVWRLCSGRFAATALSGEGARLYGGRWNHAGTPMAYCSSALSLAALEVLVHAPALPAGFVSLRIEIPAGIGITRWNESDLPPGWRITPSLSALAERGTAWARGLTTPILEVPSAIVPEETNLLVNPLHPDAKRLTVGPPEAFPFDPRLA